MRVVVAVILLMLMLPESTPGQRIFRSKSDSIEHQRVMRQISENLRNNPDYDNEDLYRRAESLIVKAIPVHKRGTYTFYRDLMRSDRPDTITRLGLYNVDITAIPTEVAKCTNLIELDISACNIRELPEWLNELSHLETVAINKSRVRRLKFRMSENSSIRFFDLSHNNLRKVPKAITSLSSLEYLNVSGNRIRMLPKLLRSCKNLFYLNVSYNRVKRNAIRVRSNPNLRGINLSHNKLTDLPFDLSVFPNLEEVNMSYNNIRSIVKNIGGDSLRTLSLYSNELDHIPDKIFDLAALVKLDLSFNRIDTVSSDIRKLKRLSFLSLSYNNVSFLPEELGSLSLLKIFFIQNNRLRELPGSFSELSLSKFDVGHNRLDAFPYWVIKNPNLEELYINNNLIPEIPEGIEKVKALAVFYFDGNPMDRNSESFKRMVTSLQKKGVEVKY